jgi:hypothetical protein
MSRIRRTAGSEHRCTGRAPDKKGGPAPRSSVCQRHSPRHKVPRSRRRFRGADRLVAQFVAARRPPGSRPPAPPPLDLLVDVRRIGVLRLLFLRLGFGHPLPPRPTSTFGMRWRRASCCQSATKRKAPLTCWEVALRRPEKRRNYFDVHSYAVCNLEVAEIATDRDQLAGRERSALGRRFIGRVAE